MRAMTRDYARRTPRRPAEPARRQRSVTSRKPQKTRSAGTSFSAPSFSAGIILGAVLMLLLNLAPRAFEASVGVIKKEVETPAPEIVFEFPDLLEQDTVVADTSPYPAEFPSEDPAVSPKLYMIQAASLKEAERASRLTSELQAAGLSARWDRVDLQSGTWFRVMVGPIEGTVEANRALTQLRQRNLGAHLIPLG
jgi:cell division protein FtsN